MSIFTLRQTKTIYIGYTLTPDGLLFWKLNYGKLSLSTRAAGTSE